MMKEFKEFAMRGSVVDMAVGIVIGGAFGKDRVVLRGRCTDATHRHAVGRHSSSKLAYELQLASTGADGTEVPAVMLNYGTFISTVVDFIIIAFAIFMVIKAMNSMKKRRRPLRPRRPSPATRRSC
ncbi:MAG: large conductance mechanosensitive channel protein MscL [Flavobacteriales bacterium]